MPLPRELAYDECARRLRAGVAGRAALTTPQGPHIIPLNYSVVEDAVIVATSPYSALGTYGPGSLVAFEVDHFDYEHHAGWSAVVRGRCQPVADHAEVQRLKQVWAPRPWANGSRNLFLRIPWSEVSGRGVGPDVVDPVSRAVAVS